MNTHADHTQDDKSKAVANSLSEKESSSELSFQFVDNRPEAIAQRKLQELADNSPQVKQLRAFQKIANKSPQVKKAAQFQAMANNHVAAITRREDALSTKRKAGGVTQHPAIPVGTTIQGVWEDSGTGVLKWDKLRDGVRWYVVQGTQDMYYLIEGTVPEAHADFYRDNEGFAHVKPRSQWLADNDFDESEKFAVEDLEVADTSSGAPRLWDNVSATFKSQNVDKNTGLPKGSDSTYVVGPRGMVRFKEATGETLSHPDRHICYVYAGSLGATRSKAFTFKTGAREKITVAPSSSGPNITVLLGDSGTPMQVSLVPIPDYRVVDFDYISGSQKAGGFHVGHPVKGG